LPSQFSATFGLPFTCSLGSNHVRAFSAAELLLCYSAPPTVVDALPSAAVPSDFAISLATCCPFNLASHFIDHLIDIHLFATIDAANSPIEFVTRSLVSTTSGARPVPSPCNWLSAYRAGPDTNLLLDCLSSSTPFSKSDILTVHSAYRDYICHDRISFLDGKLVVFQPLQSTIVCACQSWICRLSPNHRLSKLPMRIIGETKRVSINHVFIRD
jgi:hypothetical protein